ncbi:MAG: C1 family peptidase [Pseudomonadota bacterium]|nr:C1 family peptidase [Pseudomonadota bacterium]
MISFRRIFLVWFLVLFVLFPSFAAQGSGSVGGGRQKIPFLQEDDLSLIRDKIISNGYNFTVSSNWVVELSRERRARLRTRRYPTSPRRERSVSGLGPLAAYMGRSLPDRFDWRNVDGCRYIGPVRHQGSCGSCYAFGACAAAEGTYNLATKNYNENCVDFSEAFITFCLDSFYGGFDGCRGSDYEYEELDALIREGVCCEELFPYDPLAVNCPLELTVPTVKFDSWHRLPCNDMVAIKTAIRFFGVIDVSVLTNPAFDAYESGIYEDSVTLCQDVYDGPCYYAATDHVVALVGWDDNGGDGYWVLRNSWGADWGEGGYMRIKYRAAHVACAACYLVFTVDPPPVPVKPVDITPWLPLLLSGK